MGYKKCILGIGVVYFCLFPASKCSARRIHSPQSFLSKLALCVEDPSIDEALNSEFFKDNWELLDGGIKVKISDGVFLEIRKMEKEVVIRPFSSISVLKLRKVEQQVIIQLFGKVSASEQDKISLLRDNLNRQAVEFDIPVTFLDFSGIDLSKEPLSVYSILNMDDADFEVIVQDILKGGDGSGINSLPEDVLKLVDDMGRDFEDAFKYGLVDFVGLKLDKSSLVQAFNFAQKSAVERFQGIEDGRIDVPEGEKNKAIDALVSLRDRIKIYPAILNGKDGDMVYRVFYREYLMPFLENITKGNN